MNSKEDMLIESSSKFVDDLCKEKYGESIKKALQNITETVVNISYDTDECLSEKYVEDIKRIWHDIKIIRETNEIYNSRRNFAEKTRLIEFLEKQIMNRISLLQGLKLELNMLVKKLDSNLCETKNVMRKIVSEKEEISELIKKYDSGEKELELAVYSKSIESSKEVDRETNLLLEVEDEDTVEGKNVVEIEPENTENGEFFEQLVNEAMWEPIKDELIIDDTHYLSTTGELQNENFQSAQKLVDVNSSNLNPSLQTIYTRPIHESLNNLSTSVNIQETYFPCAEEQSQSHNSSEQSSLIRKPYSDTRKRLSHEINYLRSIAIEDNNSVSCNNCDFTCSDKKMLRRHVKAHFSKALPDPVCMKIELPRKNSELKPFEKTSQEIFAETTSNDQNFPVINLTNDEIIVVSSEEENDFNESINYSTSSPILESVLKSGLHGYQKINNFTSGDNNKFSCEPCSYQCVDQQSLLIHVSMHKDNSKCYVCGMLLSSRKSVIRHLRTYHGSNLFHCPYCTFKCDKHMDLIHHKFLHTGGKPHVCSTCGYKHENKSRMKEHIRKHTGERPFLCPICGKKFTTQCVVNTHIKKAHTAEKKCICADCGYSCATKRQMMEHVLIHVSKKKYPCPWCEYSSDNSANLRKHTRRHTGEKPFKCSKCEYRASDRSNIREHLRKHDYDNQRGRGRLPLPENILREALLRTSLNVKVIAVQDSASQENC